MYVEDITIDGFKSYATRTVVPGFDPQFNAITGLNGSGKSNILDSICFVLGITNLSHVRCLPRIVLRVRINRCRREARRDIRMCADADAYDEYRPAGLHTVPHTASSAWSAGAKTNAAHPVRSAGPQLSNSRARANARGRRNGAVRHRLAMRRRLAARVEKPYEMDVGQGRGARRIPRLINPQHVRMDGLVHMGVARVGVGPRRGRPSTH
jgi:hypothetical protein